MRPDVVTRFWSKVEKSDGCWNWRAGVTSAGYGNFSISHKSYSAHRIAYEIEVGPIPEGLHIDHLCRNRVCVNPEHLEPVSVRENLMRGQTLTAANARKTHCPQGHPYSPENTKPTSGARVCRICKRATQHRWVTRRQQRAAGIAS